MQKNAKKKILLEFCIAGTLLKKTASYINGLFSSYMQASVRCTKIQKNEKNGHKTNMIGWHVLSVIGHFIHLHNLTAADKGCAAIAVL